MGKFDDRLSLLCETNLETIEEVIRTKKPHIAVIDSIQTMYSEEIGSAPGSVSQVREATNTLMHLAKGMGITIFIVGHVTKEGTVAGPRYWNTWWTQCCILKETVMLPTGFSEV